MEARHRILNRGKMTEKPVERSPVTWSNERERRFRRETLRLLRWDATRHDTTLSSSSSRQIPRINRGAHAIFNTWNFFSTFTTLLFFLFPSFPCYFSFFFRFVSFFFFCFFFPFEREREESNQHFAKHDPWSSVGIWNVFYEAESQSRSRENLILEGGD